MKSVGLRMLLCAALLIAHCSFLISCSESDDVVDDEFSNWQARNEAYFATLEDSLSRGGSAWKTIKMFTKDEEIPTANYPQGYVFDETYEGNYSHSTTGIVDNIVSNFRDGFATALQHMHQGDRWRVYIPYQLGYGTSDYLTIPGYSVMIFDVTLLDFVTGSDSLDPWASRHW